MIALTRENSDQVFINANTRFDKECIDGIRLALNPQAIYDLDAKDAALTAKGYTRTSEWEPTGAAGGFGYWATVTKN